MSSEYHGMPMDVHPLVVHFPIALALTVFALDWGRWLFDRDRLLDAGFWGGSTPLLIIALLGATVAAISGYIAAGSVQVTDPLADLIETHELLALISASTLAILTFWRISLRGAFPREHRWAYLLLLLVVTITIAAGGYYGGVMVHVHGAGVAP